jgi:UTP-glucose-1-phosphate uridylyltransferase
MQPMTKELAREMDKIVRTTRTAVQAIVAEPAAAGTAAVERSRAGAA